MATVTTSVPAKSYPALGIILGLLLASMAAMHAGLAADPFWGADPTWSLLHEPVVEQELKLSSGQRLRFRALLDGLDAEFFPLRNQPPEEGRTRAAAILERAAEGLGGLLTKQQVRRLAEIQARRRGPAALLEDPIATSMAYTAPQRERLSDVISETRSAVRELEERAAAGEPRETLEKRYADLTTEEVQRVTEILTPAQRAVWRKALGRDFDLSKLGHPVYRAPELVDSGEWLNSPPLSLGSLAGHVVVVHFYAFGCINCIRNYPTYLAWQEKYRDAKVVIVGIHTPETTAEEDSAAVKTEAEGAAFDFPVLIDAGKANWNAWGNSMWPSVYLVDKRGSLRYFWPGELGWNGATGAEWMGARIDELLAEPDSPSADVHPR